jgi:hypothetical protein
MNRVGVVVKNRRPETRDQTQKQDERYLREEKSREPTHGVVWRSLGTVPSMTKAKTRAKRKGKEIE